ncbi:MAG TPA: PAS domain-containing sensor histidine kinase [Gemmatimonadaceae bacterium]|nr:PAS domain-containing sensor histidine kinase [Gemmatimonadaceae bacterium]
MPDRITEDILAQIVGIAADAVICIDDFQRITFFNKGAETIFGWTADEIIGQRVEVLMPERYRANHGRQVAEFGRSGVTARRMGERREIAGIRKSGEEFPAEAAISQVQQGDNIVYAVVLRDITVRKKFEKRQEFLAAAGEKLASAFGSGEVLQNVVALAVPALADGCILENRIEDGFRSGAACHADADINSVLQAVTQTGVRKPASQHPLAEVLRNRSPVLLRTDTAARIANSSTNAAYIDAIKAMNPHSALYLPLVARGQLIGVLSLFRSNRGFDMDDLRFAEDLGRLAALALDNSQLLATVRSSLRARDEIVGVVSHDLRNPVAAVRMLSRAVLNDADRDTEGTNENLSLIAEAAEQMDSLIRDLLDVTRIDVGQLQLALEPVDPAALIDDVLRTLRPLVSARDLNLEVEVEKGLPNIRADVERVQQVMSNLVGNAIKFTPAGGTISIGARRNGADVIFSVADTGRGISAGQLPKVFDRYWQSTRTDRQGAGLGLAIAKGIVEEHGGAISISSEPGVGTRVEFSLPA